MKLQKPSLYKILYIVSYILVNNTKVVPVDQKALSRIFNCPDRNRDAIPDH